MENLDKLVELNISVKEMLSGTGVTFSTINIRPNNGKSAITVRNLYYHLVDLNMDILNNSNITGKHLSRKALHLSKVGSTRLTKKILFIRFENLRNF